MRRRNFLGNGLSLLLAAPTIWAQSVLKQSGHSAEVQAICSLYPSSESAIELGKKYLLRHPEHCSSKLLAKFIFSGWNESERQLALTKPDILKKLLKRKVRQDFVIDHVSSLDGWILSKTELQHWALLSLVAR